MKRIKNYLRVFSLDFFKTFFTFFSLWKQWKDSDATLMLKKNRKDDQVCYGFIRKSRNEKFSMCVYANNERPFLDLYLVLNNMLTMKAYPGETFVYRCSILEFIRLYVKKHSGEAEHISGILESLKEEKNISVIFFPTFFLFLLKEYRELNPSI